LHCFALLCDRKAIASALQSLFNRFTFALQSLCNRFGIAFRSLSDRFAIALQSLCNRFAIASHSLSIASQSLCNRIAIASQSNCGSFSIALHSFAIALQWLARYNTSHLISHYITSHHLISYNLTYASITPPPPDAAIKRISRYMKRKRLGRMKRGGKKDLEKNSKKHSNSTKNKGAKPPKPFLKRVWRKAKKVYKKLDRVESVLDLADLFVFFFSGPAAQGAGADGAGDDEEYLLQLFRSDGACVCVCEGLFV
jgi:hypothetical protein